MEEKKEIEIENEIKLVNTQVKMITIENKAEIKKKLLSICELLGISMGAEKDLEIEDEYYDTVDGYLENNGFSLRKRTEKTEGVFEYFITIKSPHHARNPIGLARNEWEHKYDKAELNAIIIDTKKITAIISDKFCDKLLIPGELARKLTIKNGRICIPIKTEVAEYTLCIDKYYFFSSGDGFSEIQHEIEIEKQNGIIGRDDQLKKLHNAIKVFLNYDDSRDSKYKKASNWVKDPMHGILQKFTIMFDIVRYSMKSADIQKNSIQVLNRSVKEAIRTVFLTDERISYLPIGDGMILILEKYADKIPKLCYQVQENVRKQNEKLLNDRKIEFRTGIHVGNVFRYSDINDSPNYAGGGINKVVRVTGIGDAWHILATDDFHNYIRDLNTAYAEDFHDIGECSVKHEEKIRAYNIYNQEIGAGNPVRPEKALA